MCRKGTKQLSCVVNHALGLLTLPVDYWALEPLQEGQRRKLIFFNFCRKKGVGTYLSLSWLHRSIYMQWEERMRTKCPNSFSSTLSHFSQEVILQSPIQWQQTTRVGSWFLCWKVLVASPLTDSAPCDVQVQCKHELWMKILTWLQNVSGCIGEGCLIAARINPMRARKQFW